VLGPLHTLKGNSGMLGLTRIKEYVHRLETSSRRSATAAVPRSAAFETLFAGDRPARRRRACVAEGGAEARDLRAEQADLDALLSGRPARPPQAAPRPAPVRRSSGSGRCLLGGCARRRGAPRSDKRDVADKYVTAVPAWCASTSASSTSC